MNIPVCPYLGLQDDPETHVAFPSETNFCHHLKTPGPVNLEYQRTFCQSGRHLLCAVFPEGRYTRLPVQAQVVAGERTLIRRPWLLTIVTFLFVAGGAALTQSSAGFTHFLLKSPPQIGKTLPAPPVTVPPSPPQPSATAATVYFTSTAEIPATPVPLGLETPIGASPALLIHRVLPGESLDLIAAHFDTSVEAIQAINYFLPSPLLADLPIIIPLGQTQTAGLPQFESYQVSVAGLTIEQLAQSLGVNVVQLRKYNLLPEGTTLVAGQWLLLPRPAK